MTSTDPRFWLDFAQWITTLAIGLYVWLANHNRATRQHIKAVDEKHGEAMKDLGNRLIRVEGVIEHSPTSAQLGDLRAAQARTQGAIEAVDEKVEGIRGMVKSMQTTLFMLTENELAEGRNNKKGRK